ncbi:hypothetical protein CH625_003225 [Haemophilus influenzae]|uniref:hypothetical protein n=1 Tax=Haemophilus influenzae TaxID=727 RepID=UPI000E332C24|nr:hypothetical protein [Haemophilus influenzae]AXP54196.1 hypothetical protein CH603_03355 [Haemophilus influenzae]AXP60999.1 hypothetical protein CH624_03365 [Haemophilus influenzae]AYO33798.1 hypothetical protein CH617_08015 [Haemophilus influenzae]MCK8911141.1 hypothetical protein [Haemophilus influenzae]MCK9088590.1 hypothetical protein [Haemophilus influenzae]
MLDLILSTESRVLSTNITDFEKQADQFLSTLTVKFETDEDFAAAKEEVKILKEVEDKIRNSIKLAQSGEIAKLIESAEKIAEKFREERLKRDKLVKSKESEIKENIVNTAFENISKVRYGYESDISIALERTMPKQDLLKRLHNATARRSTLATLTKAVQAEENLILAELAQESARLIARRKLLPVSHEHLFKDWLELITSNCDLKPIVEERIEMEEQREQARIAQAQAEAEKAKTEEAETESAVEKTQENLTALADEQLQDFIISIRLNQITKSQAIAIARGLKERFGDAVKLNKVKEEK